MSSDTQTHAPTHPTPEAVPATGSVVERFLDTIRTAGFGAADHLYAETAVMDGVVPGWRMSVGGEAGIRAEFVRWFAHPATIEELDRQATATGEVVEYTVCWTEDGVPHAGRHVHVLRIDRDADRITADHVWCGGRWPASLLAEIGAAMGVADTDAGVAQ